MKKTRIFALLMVVMMCFTLITGCSKSGDSQETSEPADNATPTAAADTEEEGTDTADTAATTELTIHTELWNKSGRNRGPSTLAGEDGGILRL
jgi:hypothetical protein